MCSRAAVSSYTQSTHTHGAVSLFPMHHQSTSQMATEQHYIFTSRWIIIISLPLLLMPLACKGNDITKRPVTGTRAAAAAAPALGRLVGGFLFVGRLRERHGGMNVLLLLCEPVSNALGGPTFSSILSLSLFLRP